MNGALLSRAVRRRLLGGRSHRGAPPIVCFTLRPTAVRETSPASAPVLNASITDCVFQVARDTTIAEVNQLLRKAAEQGPLVDILGYEERPLVSSDFVGDPRSSIVDALSTRVTDRRLSPALIPSHDYHETGREHARVGESTCDTVRRR